MEYMDLKSLLDFGLPNMPRTVIGLRKKAQGELTMAQMTAYNIKKLMDAVEFEAAKRLSKAN